MSSLGESVPESSLQVRQIRYIKNVVLLCTAYIVVSLLANISSLRIVTVLQHSMDAGTLLYPLTFTLRDLIHKNAGKEMAVFTIVVGAVLNLVMFGVFYLVSALPADLTMGEQTEFGMLLLPGVRIVAGSIVAMLIAEFVDTWVYQAVVRKFKNKKQWLRVAISNACSIPLDSVIFTVIAFYAEMPNELLVSIIISNILIKYLVTVASVGSIYMVQEKEVAQR